MRRTIATIALILAFGAGWAQRPNILLIIADDLGLDPVPNYLPGPQKAVMPNLEALMANGLTFDNVWADPLCSPTRATILTGRYGLRTGVLNANALSLLPPDAITLHRYLDGISSGYATSLIGKWHLGGIPPDPNYPNTMGVPYYAGLLSGGVTDYNAWSRCVNGAQFASTAYITTAITDLAIDWIGQQSAPWFCWLAYTAPHVPFHLPPVNMHTRGALPTDQASIDADPLPYYLAMVESLDFEIGRLFGAIPPAELANTVVIFIGDNGTDRNVIQLPYPMNHAKGSLYEGGVHVPMVISGAGVTRANQREPALVNSSDLFSTIVELTGNALPTYHDSRSIAPMLVQAGLSVRECLYAEVSDQTDGHASRDARYKLITFANGNQRFHDLLLDPNELTNLLPGTLTGEQQAAFDALSTGCGIVAAVPERDAPLLCAFPNPAGELLTIAVQDPRGTTYGIRTIAGALVRSGALAAGQRTIQVGGLPTGSYIVEIGPQRTRFVKE